MTKTFDLVDLLVRTGWPSELALEQNNLWVRLGLVQIKHIHVFIQLRPL